MFIPKIGEDFQFDEHIFQMGWFNHQLYSIILPIILETSSSVLPALVVDL